MQPVVKPARTLARPAARIDWLPWLLVALALLVPVLVLGAAIFLLMEVER